MIDHAFRSDHLSESLVRAEIHHAVHGATDAARTQEHNKTHAMSIAISREIGAYGGVIARETANLLGWSVFDRELIDRIADELHISPNRVAAVDERHVDWLQECAMLLSGTAISENQFARRLVATILSLSKQGHAIFVGRGAAHILSPRFTLRVRLVAPLEFRVAAVSRERGISYKQAEQYVLENERQQQRFIKDHFQRDPTDPRHYDLVLNTARWSIAQCAGMIADALHHLKEQRSGPAYSPALPSK